MYNKNIQNNISHENRDFVTRIVFSALLKMFAKI